eukprot:scaffold20485_cov61-Cyclotella_meneghiniana.AAC.2
MEESKMNWWMRRQARGEGIIRSARQMICVDHWLAGWAGLMHRRSSASTGPGFFPPRTSRSMYGSRIQE